MFGGVLEYDTRMAEFRPCSPPPPPRKISVCSTGNRYISRAARGLLATDHVILNHGQVTWTTPELAPPLLTTTPHQREDVSALDRFSVHRCSTRRVFSGTRLELVTKPAMIRCLYHSATAATKMLPAFKFCEPSSYGKRTRGRGISNSSPRDPEDQSTRLVFRVSRTGRGLLHVKSVELKALPLAWCGNLEKGRGASSGVVFVTSPRLKITRSVADGPCVTFLCEVNSTLTPFTHA
ncbi:uncharacterized protein TNCV_2754231 [Trichonephila clavipes]|nr:uncharacterized protein TNCV_2754231 [Trichonephila clavipes]